MHAGRGSTSHDIHDAQDTHDSHDGHDGNDSHDSNDSQPWQMTVRTKAMVTAVPAGKYRFNQQVLYYGSNLHPHCLLQAEGASQR